MTMTLFHKNHEVQNLKNLNDLKDLEKLDELNEFYLSLSPAERIKQLFNDFAKEDILLTSSFGTTAVYLLHLIHQQDMKHPVHFINTNFHFDETIQYLNQLKTLLNLDVVDVKPHLEQNKLAAKIELWKSQPDLCCKINKVEPLDTLKKAHKIWISGLMHWQNTSRSSKKIFELKGGMLKFYPIIDVSEEKATKYIEAFDLPIHPLKPLGYESIGCKHCTVKGKSREGRWAGKAKTECGLHN